MDLGSLGVPAKFTSRQLIYNGDVARQYGRVPAAIHLASLHHARGLSIGWHRNGKEITDRLIDFYADYYKLQLREIAKIATFEHEVEAAKAALRAAELGLRLEGDALDLAQKALSEAENIIEKIS